MTSWVLPSRYRYVCTFAFLPLLLITSAPMLAADPPAVQNGVTSGPRIWLQENQPLPVEHVAASQGTGAPIDLSALGHSQPVSMTSGDLDGEGFEDLVVGYSTCGTAALGCGSGGYISIHRGNMDAFAPQSEASFQAIGRGEFPSPFLLQAQTFSVSVSPDFIALGDFTGNGNRDLAVAAKGSKSLFIFSGDGKGNFGTPQMVSVADGITALAAGELGSTPTLIVGGARSLTVYVSTGQGLTALASYAVSAPVSNILFGEFGDPGSDVAFLSGGKIQILRSATMQLTTVSLPVMVRAFALGGFIHDRNPNLQIAMLGADGSIQIAVHNEFDPRTYTAEEMAVIRKATALPTQLNPLLPKHTFPVNGWRIVESFPGVASLNGGQAPVFFRTQVSNHGADDVMMLNPISGQLVVVSHPDLGPGATTFLPGQVSLRPYTGTPVAAVAMRVNVSGRPGVIAIHQNEIAPSAIFPIPDPNIFVNRDDDPVPDAQSGANTCTNTGFSDTSVSCSLREAILKSNGDTVMLQGGHTYTLSQARVAGDFTGQHGTLEITKNTDIVGQVDGSGNPNSIIQAGTTTSNGVDKILSINQDIGVSSTASSHLTNLVLQNGFNRGDCCTRQDGFGGAFDFDVDNSSATVTVTNCKIINNSVHDGQGGAITVFNTGGNASSTGLLTISNSIIQNNSATPNTSGAGGDGGGIEIAASAHMTLTSVQVLNNSANANAGTKATGGGIRIDGQSGLSARSNIHGGTIQNNTAAGDGGGMLNEAALTIDTNTAISGNTAGGNGGGLWNNNSSPDTTSLSKIAITGNTATGNGGGIFTGNNTGGQPLSMSFSRLASNTAASGKNLYNDNTAITTATNNWWGTNSPSSTITNANGGTTTFDPFIVLTHTGSPDKIKINASSTLTGTMANDNHGNAVGLANLTEIIGLPITFDAAVLGTIPQAQPETLDANAQATATFNAGGTSGFGTANATVDQAIVPVNSNLIASATESGSTATITTVGAIGFSTGDFVRISGVGVAGYNSSPATQEFKVLSTPTATSFTYTANTSGLGPSSGGTVNAGIIILEPPSITKTFGGTKIVKTNTANTITFSITNGNVIPIDASFTDNLPSNVGTVPGSLVVASTPNVVNNCTGGSVTATAGSGSISFSNASLAAGTCTITVDVQSAVDNIYSNSVTIDSTAAGNGNTASDTLTVINPPHITKSFGTGTIPLNGTTSLTLTVNNANQNQTLSGISFTDTLPNTTGTLVVATPNGLTNTCSTTPTAVAGSGSITLSGASLASGASCTITVNVQGTVAGAANNSVTASDTTAGSGNTGTANLTIIAPPSIAKAFNPTTIALNATSSLQFTVTNPNTANSLTGVGFTDTLPTGLTVASSTATVCGGTLTTTAPTGISLAGATIAASGQCQFSVTVTGATAGGYTNTTGAVTSTEGGTGNTASANLTVVAPSSIAKVFNPNTIALNATTSLTFTITNPAANTVAEAGVAFTDTLPTGLTVASGTSTVCGGTLTTTNPTGISLSGATIAVNSNCQFSVTVTGAASGQYTNTTGAVSSTNGGTGNTATANLTVASPPSITKSFNPTSTPLNGISTLSFSITNPNTGVALSGVAFTDSLPSGVVVAATPNVTGSCGSGTITAVAGSGSISLSGGTLTASPGAGSSCTFSVNVTGTTAGVKNNSVQVSSTEGGTGNTSNASLTVVAPPSIAKAFNPTTIALNATTSLQFTISNLNTGNSLSGVGFTDTLPTGLTVASSTSTVCGGTLTTTAPTGISLTGATIAASGQCQFSVTVTGATAGAYTNTTGAVTSTEGGTGNTASANLTVVAPPSIAKVFNPNTIALNATTSLQFTITNPAANTVAEAGVAFSDTLPTGLTVASGTSTVCGGTLTTTNPTGISLSGATIAVNSNCQFSVTVTGAASGQYTNTTGAVSSTNGGTGNTATANLTVASPPTSTKQFTLHQIPVNGTTTLTIGITNPNTSLGLTGIAFTDSLPAGLVVAGTPNLSNSCNGTATATAGSSAVSLAGGTLAASASCAVTVTVQGSTGGVKNNSVTVTSNEAGAGAPSSDSLTVVAAPVLMKAFGATSVPLGGSTSLTFTVTNPNSTVGLTGIGFSDSLPGGLVVSTPSGLSSSCNGVATATPASSVISLAGTSLASSGSCTVSVNVTARAAGVENNITGVISSNEGGSGTAATASLVVVAPPAIAKAFAPAVIAPGGVATVRFTISAAAGNTVALSGVGFTDTLPANVVVATPNGITGNCNGGTVTAVAGSGSITLTGGTVAAAGSCVVSVNVTSAVIGSYTNTTGAVSSSNGGTGNTASATLTVANASLAISKTHVGNFARNSTGNNYTISVSNAANAGPTVGTVTVTDTLPNVNNTLVPTAMTGTGWTCTLGTLTCTRSDVLAPGASYPPITLTVTVPQNIQGNVTNSATVSGGGDPNSHTANDPTHIGPPIQVSINVNAITVNVGGTQFVQMEVDSSSGEGTINFACSGLPFGMTCSFNPPSTNQLSATVTLGITASAGTGSVLPLGPERTPPVFYAAVLPFLGLAGLVLSGRKKKALRLRWALALALAGLALVLGLLGCGGNVTTPPTPKGTFNVTVSATSATTGDSGSTVIAVTVPQ